MKETEQSGFFVKSPKVFLPGKTPASLAKSIGVMVFSTPLEVFHQNKPTAS